MTVAVPAAPLGGAAGVARHTSDAPLWTVRAVLGAATVAAVALRPPDAAELAVARGLGARILLEGRIPVRLGSEVFGAPGAWDGGLGWFGGLAAWLVGRGGAGLTTFATCVVALLALALVEARARRRASPVAALAAVGLAALCAADALRDGGGIENAAFAAGLYLLLERPGARQVVAASLLAALWCNASAQGLFAPVLAGLAALGARLERRPDQEVRCAWLACLGTALATLATPAGWTFPALAFEALRIDRGLDGLVPYHPADVSALAYRTGFTLAMLTALAVGAGRLRPGDALLWTGATLLALANGTYVAFFGVLVAPLLAASAAPAVPASFPRSAAPAGGATARALAVAAALLLCAGAGGAGLARKATPPDAAVLARALGADGRAHRLFCATLDWCSVVEALRVPGLRVFADGRVEAFPASLLAEQRQVAALKGDWRARLHARRVDAVFVRRDRAFATLLAARGGWHLAGATASLALYVRQP